MSEILTEHLYYALGWASFGLVHSVLAAESVKGRLRLGRWHRLAYNGLAAVHLGAIWASVYLLIGTYFAERRLLDRYGEAYRSYRAVTPAYIPWRGRASGG